MDMGCILETLLLRPLALSWSVGVDKAFSVKCKARMDSGEARKYRWELRILYAAVSLFEYHQGDLQYVAIYKRCI